MKTFKLLSAGLTISGLIILSPVLAQAQGVGIAADKEKQANLEKNKARQAEMKKKWNSMSKEEQEAARQRANEYKKEGYKKPQGPQSKGGNITPQTNKPGPVQTSVQKPKPTSDVKPGTPQNTVVKPKPTPEVKPGASQNTVGKPPVKPGSPQNTVGKPTPNPKSVDARTSNKTDNDQKSLTKPNQPVKPDVKTQQGKKPQNPGLKMQPAPAKPDKK